MSSTTEGYMLIRDYEHSYRGFWTDGAVCRIRIYTAIDRIPVVLCSELLKNDNTSITNAAEYIAAEVLARHLSHRFEEPEPVIWIVHYPARIFPDHGASYVFVTFATYRPIVEGYGERRRTKLGEPRWKHVEREDVERLIGPFDE